jgi:carboxyl-terminal processing protease
MDPTETKNFQSELSGTVEGIGAEVGISSGKIVIISPLTDSPAERAGLKPGDIITSIDGKSTTSLSLGDAVGKIRGKKGTVVDLAITRGSATLNFKITRDVVQTPSVISRMEQGYAYLQITRFSSETGNVFHDQLAALLKQSPKGIVVDVRNNPGGYLQTAVQIASEFLPANKVVVTERTKNKNVETLRASEGGLAIDTSLPMTVLVNGGSASASEILAGALKDNHRATLIGTKTFGKGSVQDFETLPDDSSLRLTIAHWYMPSGKGINGVGMKPDVTVTDAAAGDPVLDRAIQFLGSK